ncbi:MAG TPA: aspartate aminotransferase family protein, partial [Conexibacter sp.]|nr:aspartate aminotransferase family protein [Conexibacter sp.]
QHDGVVGSARRALGRVQDAIAAHAGGGPRPIAETTEFLVSHGAGSFLVNDSGARLLDAVSGYGVASLGHSHPRWVDAVVSQANRVAVTSLHTEELAVYLSALGGLLPERLGQVALLSTGAEAVELAVRLAQTERGRPGVLTFAHGFHGKTAAVRYATAPSSAEADALAPSWLRSAPFPSCADHDAVDYDECCEPVGYELAAIEQRADLAEIGAVLVEPVLGTSGNRPPKRGFLAGLRRLCDKRGWLLILDESITGFGRTGELFAFERFGVVPDVMVLSKGLGGGFPLSAVCASRELWERSGLTASATSSSFGGNPIACAAGMATLEIVTDARFMAQVRATSARAAVRLRQLSQASAHVARPRGVGLMLGFDLVDPATGELASAARCAEVVRACRDGGLLVAAHVPRVRLSPPLTLTVAEADLLFDVLQDVLR